MRRICKNYLLILPLIVLGGCERQAQGCEDAIKRELRSPSTFEVINTYWTSPIGPDKTHISVMVEYDAANAYGTPIRSKVWCDVPVHNGEVQHSEARIVLR